MHPPPAKRWLCGRATPVVSREGELCFNGLAIARWARARWLGLISGFIADPAAHRDQAEPEVGFLASSPCRAGLISDRPQMTVRAPWPSACSPPNHAAQR